MSKQKFLKEFEKKLAILSETEKEDILNEYRDIIEEKVKHGKTEEEAVKEFGSIDELAKEILSTYKINPEYNQKKTETEKTKDFVETTEGLIKKGAKKLSEVTENMVDTLKKSDVELTTEKIFEIILKVILVLFGLALLKLPFYFIGELGASIFNIGFAPFSWITETVWKILVEIIYLAACILVIFTLITKYTKPISKKIEATKKEKSEENITKEPIASKKKQVNEEHSSNLFITILKIFVCIVILFPMWCANFGLVVALAFIIYLLCQGVHMVGILILLLGMITIGFELAHIVYRLLFIRKRVHAGSLMIGFVMVLIGSFMTLDYVSDFTYYNTLPDDFKQGTMIYEETITTPTHIQVDRVEIIVDSNLEDYKSKIEVTYYNEYVTVEKRVAHNNIYFSIANVRNSFNWKRDIKEKLIKQLNRKEIFNYSLLDDVTVKVYVNETTKDLIQ